MYTVFSISPGELGEEQKTEPKNITLLDIAGHVSIHTYRTTRTLQIGKGM